MSTDSPTPTASEIKESDYKIISEFYGRDLGGYRFFIWKHFADIDNQQAPIKNVLRYPDNVTPQGIIISSLYSFGYNQQHRTINLIGDLGIEDSVKSPNLVKHLILSASLKPSDCVLCFSDNRKIRVYKKIFDKWTDCTNIIIPFYDTIIQPQTRAVKFCEIPIDNLDSLLFINNLGRIKDAHYFTYLLKNPRYQRFHTLQHGEFYCVLGITADYAEIVELSNTTDEIFAWAIQVSQHFHRYCKILLPQQRFSLLTQTATAIIEQKEFNLLLSMRPGKSFDIDPEHTWVSRLDRR